MSDTRKPESDASGRLIGGLLVSAGHQCADPVIVPDEITHIREAWRQASAVPGLDGAILTGGTGITGRDRTVEALDGVITTPLPGFGELFRALSFGEVGPRGILSRACAGLAETGQVIFALPGSESAVRLAMERIIIPVLPHLLHERDRDR